MARPRAPLSLGGYVPDFRAGFKERRQ